MAEQTKKPWKKPEIIIVVRNQPEESVLGTCKNPSAALGPSSANCQGYGHRCYSKEQS